METPASYSRDPQPGLLRISITDRCNFRCRYCMPESGPSRLAHSDLLTFEELVRLARWVAPRLGIARIKLTGGEPLVRAKFDVFVKQLAAIPGVSEVSATTNGSCLAQLAAKLKAAGLSRVNVSLDTLDEGRFHELTRGGCLADTLAGIDAAVSAGLFPIKLNSVLQRSFWQQDVPLLLDYAAAHNFELRFIELMRTGTERAWCESEFLAASRVQLWLSERGRIIHVVSSGAGPARSSLVIWKGVPVHVGWITPQSQPFCATCDRLRLDARGRLYRCLMDPKYLDLHAVLRRRGEAEASEQFVRYLSGKTVPLAMDNATTMNLIGG